MVRPGFRETAHLGKASRVATRSRTRSDSIEKRGAQKGNSSLSMLITDTRSPTQYRTMQWPFGCATIRMSIATDLRLVAVWFSIDGPLSGSMEAA